MNKPYALVRSALIAFLFVVFATPLIAQHIAGIQMAELTKKLHLTDQQQKELAPVVEQRDREAAPSTEVRLRHELLPNDNVREDHKHGWIGTFEKLEKYLGT